MSKKRPARQKKPTVTSLAQALPAELFKALADPRRVAILVRVATSNEPCCVGEVAACCPTDFSVVSRHLAQLRDAGILTAVKRGRQVYYSVQGADLAASLRAVADALDRCDPPRRRKSKGRKP